MKVKDCNYFTPDIEDISIGYIAEIQIPLQTSLFNGKYSEILSEFKIEPIRNGYDLEYIRANPSRIRVSYLTKEQIESLGWIYTGKAIDIWFKKEGSFQIGNWTSYKIVLHYGLQDHRLFIYADDTGTEHPLFEGECKSINELKLISKWLNIE